MENGRQVKKSYCILSVAYVVIGAVLLFWPDISVHTFCFVFGIGMIIFGGAHLILYFTKDRNMQLMQPDLVIGVICVATGAYVLLKMEYMLEIIPFAMGIVALLGGVVKLQSALDLRRLLAKRWYLMLILSLVLIGFGLVLIANPFDEQQEIVVILIGISLLIDGIGNLISIFWTGLRLKRRNVMPPDRSEVIPPPGDAPVPPAEKGKIIPWKPEKEKKDSMWKKASGFFGKADEPKEEQTETGDGAVVCDAEKYVSQTQSEPAEEGTAEEGASPENSVEEGASPEKPGAQQLPSDEA